MITLLETNEKEASQNTERINEYINKGHWSIKENANSNTSYSGLKAYVADEAVRNYALNFYPDSVRALHSEGYVHIHNLSDGIVPYCFGGDLLKLLNKGLRTARISSKPAKHLDTAVDHMANYLCTSQQEWAGAQAFSNVNTLLAPFISKDDLSYEEVRQSMQRLIYNLNFPSRSGYQTPFTNLVFNIGCPKNLRELPADDLGNTYEDFPDESEMILRAFNDIMYHGDNDSSVFTFPIPTINLIKSTDFSSDLFYELMRTDVKYGIYYFMNFIGSGIDEDTVQAMCCRLNLDLSQLPPAGGRWAMSGGTGSIGVITMNLGRLGYISKSEDELYENMDYVLENIKDALLIKGDIIDRSFKTGLMPLSQEYGVDINRFFRTVGVVGLNELLINFTGEPLSHNVEMGRTILNYIRAWTKKTQEETGKLWNLEMTPAEGSATSLAQKDKRLYGSIFTQGTDKAPYYTSLLTPPNENLAFSERLSIEEKLLPIFTGGTVHRIYMGEAYPDINSMVKLTERITRNTKIPYFDFTATFSVCRDCKQNFRGVHWECPVCGSKTKVMSRVVGYYREVDRYNVGKEQEFKERNYVTL